MSKIHKNDYTVLTLCCWGSFVPGYSCWTQTGDWTRRQAGSSRPHAAHIHNHCQRAKHINNNLININMWKGTYCHTVCPASLSYLSLFNWRPAACLAQRHVIIMYWLKSLLANAPQESRAYEKHTLEGGCHNTPRWGTLTFMPASNSKSQHDLHLTKQGKQMSILMMLMTLIHQLPSQSK